MLNRAASTLGPGADAMQSALLRIEHADPAFKVAARFVPREGTPIEWALNRTSDGQAIVDGPNTASLRWDGDALVAEDATVRPNFEFRMSWRYELIDGGRRLRATERLRATTHDQDNVWMFDRLNA